MLVRGTIKDPRVQMATISAVEVSKDLRSAKVWVQVIGSATERKAAVTGLQSAAGFLRRELTHRLSLRSVPELRFVADESGERADRVMGLLSQIDRDRAGGAPESEESEESEEGAGSEDDESE